MGSCLALPSSKPSEPPHEKQTSTPNAAKKGKKRLKVKKYDSIFKGGGEKHKPENDVEIDMHVQRKQTNYH